MNLDVAYRAVTAAAAGVRDIMGMTARVDAARIVRKANLLSIVVFSMYIILVVAFTVVDVVVD